MLQSVNGEPSMLHWKSSALPGAVSGSEPENWKVGVVSELSKAGVETMVVSGAWVSTTQSKVVAAVWVLPAVSVASTAKVCGPPASTGVENGLAQAL